MSEEGSLTIEDIELARVELLYTMLQPIEGNSQLVEIFDNIDAAIIRKKILEPCIYITKSRLSSLQSNHTGAVS